MKTKVRYSLSFIKTVCSNYTKNSGVLEVSVGLVLDGGFGVELRFEFELQQRRGLIQSPGVVI